MRPAYLVGLLTSLLATLVLAQSWSGPLTPGQFEDWTRRARTPTTAPATAPADTLLLARGKDYLVHQVRMHVVHTTLSTGQMKVLVGDSTERVAATLHDDQRLYVLTRLVEQELSSIGTPIYPSRTYISAPTVSVYMLESGKSVGRWPVEETYPAAEFHLIADGVAFGKQEFTFDGSKLIKSPTTAPATVPAAP